MAGRGERHTSAIALHLGAQTGWDLCIHLVLTLSLLERDGDSVTLLGRLAHSSQDDQTVLLWVLVFGHIPSVGLSWAPCSQTQHLVH